VKIQVPKVNTKAVETLEDLENQKRELLTGINIEQRYLRIFKDHTKHRSKVKTTKTSPTARTIFDSKNNQMLDHAHDQELQSLDTSFV